MARLSDIERDIRAAIVTDAKQLGILAKQCDEVVTCSLREAHARYLANRQQARAHEESMAGLWALLGADRVAALIRSDTKHEWWIETGVTETVADLRARAKLWEHVAQYLRFNAGAQVAEILAFFESVDIQATRQAVEAAVRAHPKVFAVRKRGRERFISLKESG